MLSNFDFLKKTDKALFSIVEQAEEMYRDEYFEPCIVQIRKYGEAVCKNILKDYDEDNTFDNMLATLSDKAGTEQEKEFIQDLYFIKKQGNISVHSGKITKPGMTALECLKRAFEVAINYSVYYKKADASILSLIYDTELLVTGEKSNASLKGKYIKAKTDVNLKVNNIKNQKKNGIIQNPTVRTEKRNLHNFIFKIILVISCIFSLSVFLTIFILLHI